MKIKSKQEYRSAMAEVESLYQKGFSNLSNKEEDKLEELAEGIEAWESVEYPMPISPRFSEILDHLIDTRDFTQCALAEALNISNGYLSQLRQGIKSPNTEVLVNMHHKFQIDGNLLLESLAPK
ncbi:hypothetical protein [Chitinophaga sp. sic0106]|uniref:hypothetical protein n=1 Tax=Chitinophaga sp. sic0106 TaxID=2854785 RepID=UPI001C43B8DD|nr:hypothetical protein [Chitinophaga sp. sic0106]MBV7532981.1 hypothetical protein [Chitinophaga sp. sic0106]